MNIWIYYIIKSRRIAQFTPAPILPKVSPPPNSVLTNLNQPHPQVPQQFQNHIYFNIFIQSQFIYLIFIPQFMFDKPTYFQPTIVLHISETTDCGCEG